MPLRIIMSSILGRTDPKNGLFANLTNVVAKGGLSNCFEEIKIVQMNLILRNAYLTRDMKLFEQIFEIVGADTLVNSISNYYLSRFSELGQFNLAARFNLSSFTPTSLRLKKEELAKSNDFEAMNEFVVEYEKVVENFIGKRKLKKFTQIFGEYRKLKNCISVSSECSAQFESYVNHFQNMKIVEYGNGIKSYE